MLVVHILIGFSLLLLFGSGVSFITSSDIHCLKAVKDSLIDPFNFLNSSWNFDDAYNGFICDFVGVECWHSEENKVLSIHLKSMGLQGRFPRGLEHCTSLTGLDLSYNNFYGDIPSDISKMLKFVTVLDLSSNNFSGEIPADLSNCFYLNSLMLDLNQFSGQIPVELSSLKRLNTFSVANNLLTGPVPFLPKHSYLQDSYANNSGLCGEMLSPCRAESKKSRTWLLLGVVIGLAVAAIGIAVGAVLYLRRASRKRKEDDPKGNKWAKNMKGARSIEVSLFENSISKMRLSDLMKASDNFSKNNMISTTRTGNMYKAVLADGTSLMVKRLGDSQHSTEEFTAEMMTLGSVKHRNLVPLLGFCTTKNEKLLVYKYMPNGTLYDYLHCENKLVNWHQRLKIALEIVRGLSWLHHNCNPRIIHRNISSKNILLDLDFEPKISDFGLARLMNPVDSHLSTLVNGEFGEIGYVAPEYARTLAATPKGDVYSCGVVLLELVSGERPTDVSKAPDSFKGSLVSWVLQLVENHCLHDVVDVGLLGNGTDGEIFQFLKIACSCVLSDPKERPTMFEVHQFVRAIGERYSFTTDDDFLLPLYEDGTGLVELIVAN